MERKTVILTRDDALAEVCAAEIAALGLPAPEILSSMDELPTDCALLLVDLDAFPSVTAVHAVGITRRHDLRAVRQQTACETVLHRPLSLDALRAVLSPLARESTAPRRRLTVRRLPRPLRREASLSLCDDGATRIAHALFEYATDIHFFVGCAINPAHQNPNLPIAFGAKFQLIDQLSKCLEKMGKKIRVSYF